MATIYQYFDKKTFEPEKNYFSVKEVRCSRLETTHEIQLSQQSDKWQTIGFYCISLGCLIGSILMATFCFLVYFSNWFYAGVVAGIIFVVGGIIFANAACWPNEQKYSEELIYYRQEHEEALWAEATKDLKVYNEEQEKIAEAWRAEHPFEEHIRTCIKDPNSSVAIASAAKYYADNYLTKELK